MRILGWRPDEKRRGSTLRTTYRFISPETSSRWAATGRPGKCSKRWRKLRGRASRGQGDFGEAHSDDKRLIIGWRPPSVAHLPRFWRISFRTNGSFKESSP